jgi:hypothetical protein
MTRFSIGSFHLGHRLLLILSLIFIVLIITALVVTYLAAVRTRERLASSQELSYQKPAKATVRQIKKIILERDTPTGTEFLEISENGQVCLYDAQHVQIKCGFQGYARTRSVFNDLNNQLDHWLKGLSLTGYRKLTVETNLGTIVVDLHGGSGGGGGGIIDEIEDLGNDTFTPTPTLIPTPTLKPNQPEPTLTPTPVWPTFGPTIVVTPGLPTPTPLPAYLLLPPFKCEDYKLNHPFTISNVVCNAN